MSHPSTHLLAEQGAGRPTGRTTRALAVALSSTLGFAACTAPPDGAQDRPPSGATRGELVTYIGTFDDGTSEEQHFLRVGGDERRMLFDKAPDLPSGALLDVWGSSEGDRLRVARWEPVPQPIDGVESVERAVIDGKEYAARRFAMVLVDLGAGVNVAKDLASRRLFGTVPNDVSVRQYYIEASYGRQDVGGDVFGPFKHTMQGCDVRGMASAIKPMVPDGYHHYLWYMGARNSACEWTGLATTGSPERPSRDTWYNGSTSCVVLVQEPGHNFGMRHSSSMKCTGGAFHDAPMGNCTHSEYGDTYDPMGRSCRHMNAFQKAYQGWLEGCNLVEATSSTTVTLLPLELPCDGVQAIQVAMPKPRPFFRSGGGGPDQTVNLTHYYLELRAPYGIDKGLAPQVQVRVSTDTRQRTQGGMNTWLLDMNPATANFDGLGAGGTFSDPAGGVKFTVESIDATRASVKIELENGNGMPPVCLDGKTLEAAGPGPDSCEAVPSMPGAAPPAAPPRLDGGMSTMADGGGPPKDAGAPEVASPIMDARRPDVPRLGTVDAGIDAEPDARMTLDARPTTAAEEAMVVDAARPRPGATTGGSKPEETADAAAPVEEEPTGGVVRGGCGCDTGGPTRGSPGAALALLFGFGVVVRRWRRRAR